MKKEDAISYIEDFMSMLFQRIDSRPIRRIILFGSVARGDFDEHSDIDLFIDLFDGRGTDAIREKIERLKFDFEGLKKSKWKARGVDFDIAYAIGDLESDEWKPLRRSITSAGIVLYGKFDYRPEEAIHYTMVRYEFGKLKPKKKMVIIRKLFGYSKAAGGKVYRKEGLLKQMGGKKLRKGMFIVPTQKTSEVLDFLKDSGVKFQLQEIWGERSIEE
ncbi:hypothetical protein A3K63_03535 [Candidatus Micrarchaeota archaeon RBG_16_49_10]|nr:MAG: hypothetical protein A3K63_03535 [Candidatus Micrarchaeota archaeon RBG_16_49_10]